LSFERDKCARQISMVELLSMWAPEGGVRWVFTLHGVVGDELEGEFRCRAPGVLAGIVTVRFE